MPLRSEADVAAASRHARTLGTAAGLEAVDAVGVATAVSEIGTNVLLHGGGRGEALIEAVDEPDRAGVRVRVRDRGPGIPDLESALTDGYTTGGGLGLGLPGARRLMDDFAVRPRPGGGVEVEMAKWSRTPPDRPGPPLCSWAAARAGDGAGAAFVVAFRPGFLAVALAVSGPERAARRTAQAAEALLRAAPGESPVVLAERCRLAASPGTVPELALASFNALDGRLVWTASDGAAGVLVPSGRGAGPVPAPVGRGATLAVSRGDRLALAAPAVGDLEVLRDGPPRAVAQGALPVHGAGVAVGLVMRRGKDERRPVRP